MHFSMSFIVLLILCAGVQASDCIQTDSNFAVFPVSWLSHPPGALKDIKSDYELGNLRPFVAPLLHGGWRAD